MNNTGVNLTTDDSGLFEFQAADGFRVTFEYAGNDTVTSSDASIVVSVVPVPKDVSVIKIVSVDDKGLITGSLSVLGNPIVNATVVATMNNTGVNLTTDDSGLFEFQAADGFRVTFEFAGNDTVTSSDASISVSVVPVSKDVSVIKIISVDSKGLITGSLSVLDKPIANAIVVATMNNTKDNLITDNAGLFQFQAADGYRVAFEYAGNETTTSSDTSIMVNIVTLPKNPSVIKIISVDGKGLITGSLSVLGNPIANAIVVATMNGNESSLVTDNAGLFQFKAINGLEAVFKYAGDYNTTSSDASFTVNIEPETNITVIVDGKEYNGELVNGTVAVETGVPEPVTNITVIVDGKEYNGELVNGTVAVETGVPEPVTNVTVIVDGKEYSGELVNGTVAVETGVPEPVTNVTVIVDGKEYSGELVNGTVAVETGVPEPVTNVTVIVDGKEYSGELVNGTVAVEIGVPEPVTNVTVIVDGKEYSGELVNGSVAVETGVPEPVTNITVVVDGVNYPAEVVNGSVVIKTNATKPVYNSVVTVINAEDYTTSAIDFDAGERGNFFKIQLVDEKGNILANKPVKIGFNGKVYDKVTNGTGWAELQINLKKAGTYTFAVAFLGDENYTASFVVQKIIVNKKTTSISASAKTYKTTKDNKYKYTVTLKTDKGSSIDGKAYLKTGKKVTLKVNGKTYTAKTDANGKATFNLKITKKGKYSATVKFAGDDTYKAASKTTKIVIK